MRASDDRDCYRWFALIRADAGRWKWKPVQARLASGRHAHILLCAHIQVIETRACFARCCMHPIGPSGSILDSNLAVGDTNLLASNNIIWKAATAISNLTNGAAHFTSWLQLARLGRLRRFVCKTFSVTITAEADRRVCEMCLPLQDAARQLQIWKRRRCSALLNVARR